jgi:Ni/Co efflux regulator RcnB
MRKIVTVLAACSAMGLGALALAAQSKGIRLAQTQEETGQAQTQKEPAAPAQEKMTQRGSGTLAGIVQGYDKDKGYLTVRVPVSRNAQITRDGQPARVQTS